MDRPNTSTTTTRGSRKNNNSSAEVSGFLRRATTSSSIPIKGEKSTSPNASMLEPGSSSGAASPTPSTSISGTRLRSRSLLTLDTSPPAAPGMMMAEPAAAPSSGLPDLRVTPCRPSSTDDGQVCSSPIVGQPSSGMPSIALTPSPPAAQSSRDSHYRSSRPRSSSLNNYLPSPNHIAARGKDLLSRWRPMSYVSVPLQSPAGGEDQPASDYLSEKSSPRPRPLGSATTPTVAELGLLPSADSPGVYSLMQPICILAALFALSTCAVIFLLSTVPVLSLPHNLKDVLHQAAALKQYARTSTASAAHVLVTLSLLFIYKQAFSIPGSLLTNCLFGSLYGVAASTVLTSVLTAIGSMGCYYMARKTSPFFKWLFPKALTTLQASINNSGDVFSHLLLIRLFPLLPYAMLNVAAGVIGVPAQPFFWTLVLGSAPFNAVTTQIGDLLASLPPDAAAGDLSSIWTPSLLFKLLCISVLSALPVLFKKQIKQLLGSKTPDLNNGSHSTSDTESTDSRNYELWAPASSALRRFTGRRTASIEEASSGSDDEELMTGRRSSEDAAEMALLGAGSSYFHHHHPDRQPAY